MKIGIITVHRAYNYGSVLQCYALQEYLKKQGHDVWVIDYRQQWTEAVYSPFSIYYIWHFLSKGDYRAIIDYVRKSKIRWRVINQQKRIFKAFIRKFNLTASCRRRVPKGFDVYLVGSDQLWTHQCVGGEDKFYLGYFKHSPKSKVVGYSLSASTTSLHEFGKERLPEIIGNFDKLSFRELSNAEMVRQMTGIQLPITIDPTLLADADLWDSMVNDSWKDRNFIAIYQARPVVGNNNYLKEKALVMAGEMQCEIIDLRTMEYTVEDFVSIIKYAKCVLTTSYHATVFSMLMETPCYAIKLNDGLDVRYVDLLTELGLEEELVDMDFEPKPLTIDFSGLKDRIKRYKESSVEYLASINDDKE